MKLSRIFAMSVAAAALCLAAPALTACDTLSGVVHPVDKTTATRAMIDAEAAFNAAAISVQQAKAAGVLTGDNAAHGDRLIQQAYAALLIARSAYQAGTAPSTASLLVTVAQVTALIQGAGQ